MGHQAYRRRSRRGIPNFQQTICDVEFFCSPSHTQRDFRTLQRSYPVKLGVVVLRQIDSRCPIHFLGDLPEPSRATHHFSPVIPSTSILHRVPDAVQKKVRPDFCNRKDLPVGSTIFKGQSGPRKAPNSSWLYPYAGALPRESRRAISVFGPR